MGLRFMQLAIICLLLSLGSAISCESNQYYLNGLVCVNCPQNCTSCSNA
jgi:hypothetical protein